MRKEHILQNDDTAAKHLCGSCNCEICGDLQYEQSTQSLRSAQGTKRITNDERSTTLMIQTLEWTDHGVRFIDQTKLPTEEVYVNCKTHEQVADVIRNMVVRGAPAIGVAAAMGIALGVNNSKAESTGDLKRDFDQICDRHRQNAADGGESFLGDSAHAGKIRAHPHPAHSADQAGSDRRSASACTRKTLRPTRPWDATAPR